MNQKELKASLTSEELEAWKAYFELLLKIERKLKKGAP